MVSVTMISMGTFLGVTYYNYGNKYSGEAFYNANCFHDFEILTNNGISQKEIDQLRRVSGVADAEGFQFLKGIVSNGSVTEETDLISLTDRIDVPELTEGRLPQARTEIAVTREFAAQTGMGIGDAVEIHANEKYDKYLAEHSFTITGIVLHPYYLKKNVSESVILREEVFDLEGQEDYYLRAIIKVEYPARVDQFEDEYFDAVEPAYQALELALKQIVVDHDAQLSSIARESFDEAKKEVEEKLRQAEKELSDAKAEYDQKIAEAKEQIEAGQRELLENETLLAEKEQELEDGKKEYEKAKKAAEEELKKAEKKLADGKEELAKAAKEIAEGEQKIANGEKELSSAKAAYASAKQEYEAALKKIESAVISLEQARDEAKVAQILIVTLENAVENAAQSSGISIPEKYYQLTALAEEAFMPVMELQVNGENTETAEAQARQSVENALQQVIDEHADVLFMLQFLTARDLLNLGNVFYGSYSVTDLINDLDPYFENGFPSKNVILLYLALHPEYNYTIGDFLNYVLYDSDFDLSALDVPVGPYVNAGITWAKGILAEGFIQIGRTRAAVKVIQEKLDEIEAKKADAAERLRSAEAQLQNGEKELEDARAKLIDAKRQYDEGAKQISDGEKKLASEKKRAEKELKEAEKKIADGEEQIAEGKKKLADGKEELESGTKEFQEKKEDGARQLSEARKEIDEKKAEAEEKLKEAEEKVNAVGGTKDVLQGRGANRGYVEFTATKNSVTQVANIFISLFLVIGILVCFTTITIIIEEQKKQVGTSKALGFSNGAIYAKYLTFGLSAVAVGNLLGIGLSFILQDVFRRGARDMFVFDEPMRAFVLWPAIVIILVEFLTAFLATYIASRRQVRLPAVQLLTGQTQLKMKNGGKAKSTKKGTLYSRLILRNVMADKGRVFASVFIVAGSCFLIGTGANIRNAFSGMIDAQVYQVQKYNASVSFSPERDPELEEGIEKILEDHGVEYDKITQTATIAELGEQADYVMVLVLNREMSSKFMDLRDPKTGKTVAVPEEGILVQNKMQENYQLDPGAGMTLYDETLHARELTVQGSFVNYFGRYVIVSPKSYEKIFGKEAQTNTFFVLGEENEIQKIISEVLQIAPDAVINTPAKQRETYAPLIAIYNMIVGMTVLLAVIMSIFVLANLTNIFVNKKKTEVIIMRVNGFSHRQVLGYLIRETVAIVIAGFILAFMMGLAFTIPIIRVVESPDVTFLRTIDLRAWLFAFGCETVFATIINGLAFRKVKGYHVTDLTR